MLIIRALRWIYFLDPPRGLASAWDFSAGGRGLLAQALELQHVSHLP